MDDTLDRALAEAAQTITRTLDDLLPKTVGPEARLAEAMRYAVLSGGKRLRPFLTLEMARLFGVAKSAALRVAAAIECIHCYSLVHDDLPAMDDDDLRRGLPTVHKAFDEATAILVGDALLTYAFELLADGLTHDDPRVQLELIGLLAKASGPQGMVAGQMADLAAANADLDIGAIIRLQKLKTGALIEASAEAGAALGRASGEARAAIKAYAHDLGLAFQIADDLLDAEGQNEEVGKRLRKDHTCGKATFVSQLGSARARTQADLLVTQAIGHLDIFGARADLLRKLACFVVARRA